MNERRGKLSALDSQLAVHHSIEEPSGTKPAQLPQAARKYARVFARA